MSVSDEQYCWYCNNHISLCQCRNKKVTNSFKHGDRVSLIISEVAYDGHIEKRMINQWPDERFDMFVVVDNTEIPHFPISVTKFKESYGNIYLKHQ